MSASKVREEVHRIVDRLDETFLNVVHSMLDAYEQGAEDDPVLGFDIDGTPRTASELTSMMDNAVQAAENGDFMTIEKFKEESAKWGQSTK